MPTTCPRVIRTNSNNYHEQLTMSNYTDMMVDQMGNLLDIWSKNERNCSKNRPVQKDLICLPSTKPYSHALRQCRSCLIFQYSIVCNAYWAPQNYPNIPKLYVALHWGHSFFLDLPNNSFLRIPGNLARYPVGVRSTQWMSINPC